MWVSLVCIWGCLGTLVVAVTVQLFVVHVSMPRECKGDEILVRETGVVVVGAGHEYVAGRHISGIVSSATDVLGMVSLVHGMRWVGGLCEMCKSLTRGGMGGDLIIGLGLGFTKPVCTEGVLNVCLCLGCSGVCVVGMEWVGYWTRVWKSVVVLYVCELWIWIRCVDGRSRSLYSVLGGYLRILVHPVFNHFAPYWCMLPTEYLVQHQCHLHSLMRMSITAGRDQVSCSTHNIASEMSFSEGLLCPSLLWSSPHFE